MTANDRLAPEIALRQKYMTRLKSRCESLRYYAARLERDGLVDSERTELKRLVHSMAGSGTTYGFPAVSESARRLERHFDLHGEDADAEAVALAGELLVVCEAVLED